MGAYKLTLTLPTTRRAPRIQVPCVETVNLMKVPGVLVTHVHGLETEVEEDIPALIPRRLRIARKTRAIRLGRLLPR